MLWDDQGMPLKIAEKESRRQHRPLFMGVHLPRWQYIDLKLEVIIIGLDISLTWVRDMSMKSDVGIASIFPHESPENFEYVNRKIFLAWWIRKGSRQIPREKEENESSEVLTCNPRVSHRLRKLLEFLMMLSKLTLNINQCEWSIGHAPGHDLLRTISLSW